jgi:hypothetical protein
MLKKSLHNGLFSGWFFLCGLLLLHQYIHCEFSYGTSYDIGFSTYFGGNGEDYVGGVTLDATGNIYITGFTSSTNLPMVNSYDDTYNGGVYDIYIIKLNPTGTSILYSTYIGGSGGEGGHGIAVDEYGNIYIAGYTNSSSDFPLENALYSTYHGGDGALTDGGSDSFFLKLSSNGSSIIFSSYIGGSGDDPVYDIDIDSSHNLYLTGWTSSNNYPTTGNAYDTSYNGGYDIIISKINSSGNSLLYSSYLGGGNPDVAFNIEADNSGNAYLAGRTDSSNFPTVNAYQSIFGGNTYDGFLTKMNTEGLGIIFSTFLGGSDLDSGNDVAIDNAGNVYTTGQTRSTDFPIFNAYQNNIAGIIDSYVSKFNSSGSVIFSTYLGASGSSNTGVSQGEAITVDSVGNIYVTGITKSPNFPLLDPIQNSFGGGTYDRFISKFNVTGSNLLFSTYLGGSGNDQGFGIATDTFQNIYVTGYTDSTDFPTKNAIQSSINGVLDTFLVKYTNLETIQGITILSPNGGETWQAGTTQTIVYSASPTISYVSLQYSTDAGASWNSIVASIPNSGSYAWMIPNVSSSTCLVKIADASDGEPWDVSDNFFAIIGSPSISTIYLTPTNPGVYRNQEIELTVHISDATNVIGYRVAVDFDPNQITYVSGSATITGTSCASWYGPLVNSASAAQVIFTAASQGDPLGPGNGSLLKFRMLLNGALADNTIYSDHLQSIADQHERRRYFRRSANLERDRLRTEQPALFHRRIGAARFGGFRRA